MKRFAFLAAPLVFLLLITGCWGGYGPMGGWGHMMNYGFGYGGMFMWIIFLITLGVLIYYLFSNQKLKGRPPIQDESPLDILKKRYAKGEINKDDFDRMKKDLES